MIKILTRQKQDWINSSCGQYIGLEKHQSVFYDKIVKESYNSITGKSIAKVFQSLKSRPQSRLKDEIKSIKVEFNKSEEIIKAAISSVKKVWKTYQTSISRNSFVQNFKTLFSISSSQKKSFPKAAQQIKSCHICKISINNSQIYPLPTKFQIKNITLLSLDYFNPKCAQILGQSSIKLTHLFIGTNIQKSNVDNTCCRSIGHYMKQITHLIIQHSPMTDQGGKIIAQQIPNLHALYLRFNLKMTPEGKKFISKMIPNCDFR